jgi:hypothetical protein
LSPERTEAKALDAFEPVLRAARLIGEIILDRDLAALPWSDMPDKHHPRGRYVSSPS